MHLVNDGRDFLTIEYRMHTRTNALRLTRYKGVLPLACVAYPTCTECTCSAAWTRGVIFTYDQLGDAILLAL